MYDKLQNYNIVISLFNVARNYRKSLKYDKALEKYR